MTREFAADRKRTPSGELKPFWGPSSPNAPGRAGRCKVECARNSIQPALPLPSEARVEHGGIQAQKNRIHAV